MNILITGAFGFVGANFSKAIKTAFNTNCYSKCRTANFEFTMVNADRPIKQQIKQPIRTKSGK